MKEQIKTQCKKLMISFAACSKKDKKAAYDNFVGTVLSSNGLKRVIGGGWGTCKYAECQPNVKQGEGCDCSNFSNTDQTKNCSCGHSFSAHYDSGCGS